MTSTFNPDWLVLIRDWTQKNIGYALPFLVGARARINGQDNVTTQDARELLDEIFHPSVASDVLQLIWCPNLDAPVFGLNKVSIPGETFISKHTGCPSLVVREDILARWDRTVEAICDGVMKHCRESFEKGKFSRTWRRTWDEYSTEELRRIDNLLGRAANR